MSGILILLGGLLFIVGYIWIVITAILTGKTGGEKALWAVVNLICQPITGIIFVIVRRQGLIPLILIILGIILVNGGVLSDPQVMREIFKALR
jgi:hypothetical protein